MEGTNSVGAASGDTEAYSCHRTCGTQNAVIAHMEITQNFLTAISDSHSRWVRYPLIGDGGQLRSRRCRFYLHPLSLVGCESGENKRSDSEEASSSISAYD